MHVPSPRRCAAVLAFAAVLAVPARAQEPAPAGPQMSAEEAAMMKAWQEAMTPGEPHQGLAEMAGNWNATVRVWMQPGAEPTVSQGKATREMILGGRVLQERFEGSFMDQPFTGLGMTGYDNVAGKYWSTWMDSMSTGMMLSHGTYDPATRTATFTGEMMDPMTRTLKSLRMVNRHEGADKETMEMYEAEAGGPERKSMEIVYERVK